MPAEDLFGGFEFGPEYISDREDREVQRTGRTPPELAEVKRNIADWSDADYQSFNDQGAQLERRVLALLRAGVPHDDAATWGAR